MMHTFQSGRCINVNARDCVGADVLTGFCAGAADVKCCPSSQSKPKAGAAGGSGSGVCEAPGMTVRIQGGPDKEARWFDTIVFQCAETAFNSAPQYAAGDMVVRCVPCSSTARAVRLLWV